MAERMNTAQALVEGLAANGIETLYALPGVQNDPSTLLLSPESMFGIYPHIYRRTMRYVAEDFIPVTAVTEFAFAVATAHPAKTWPEFVAWAKRQAEPVSYATPAAGSTPHSWAEQCGRAHGIRLGHVAYRGMGPAYPDLYAGRLQAGATVFGDLLEQQRGGHLRILAVSMPERSAEALHASIVEALAHPELRAALGRMEQTPRGTGPADFAARIRAERERWGPIVAASGYVVED